MRARVLIAIIVATAGCGGDKAPRLSQAECGEFAARTLDGPGGMDLLGGDDALAGELKAALVAECLEGRVDRAEYACVMAATTLDQHITCTEAGVARRRGGAAP